MALLTGIAKQQRHVRGIAQGYTRQRDSAAIKPTDIALGDDNTNVSDPKRHPLSHYSHLFCYSILDYGTGCLIGLLSNLSVSRILAYILSLGYGCEPLHWTDVNSNGVINAPWFANGKHPIEALSESSIDCLRSCNEGFALIFPVIKHHILELLLESSLLDTSCPPNCGIKAGYLRFSLLLCEWSNLDGSGYPYSFSHATLEGT
ncbi:hypothetical protein Tco_0981699 [Tanacetum coccineum]